jgi:hypothetical protein
MSSDMQNPRGLVLDDLKQEEPMKASNGRSRPPSRAASRARRAKEAVEAPPPARLTAEQRQRLAPFVQEANDLHQQVQVAQKAAQDGLARLVIAIRCALGRDDVGLEVLNESASEPVGPSLVEG